MIGLSDGEQRIEVAISQAVRMFRTGLQLEQIDDVNKANFQIGESLS